MKPGVIQIKTAAVLKGLMSKQYEPTLIEIIVWVAISFGLVLTESYRKKTHGGDLHGTTPVRANDLRTWCYPDGQAQEIAQAINDRWLYDPNRPHMKVAIIHDSGRGIHFHIQTHPNTVRR